MKRLAALLCLAGLPIFAAVDGKVANGTTGKPAAGIAVALVQPSQSGMKTLGTAKTDGDGKFSFADSLQGPGLVQATFQGVTYSKMIMPGTPSTGLNVQVYEATRKPVAKVAQHMILLQPAGSEITVNETILMQGDDKLTYNDAENGTVHFWAPPNLKGDVSVSVNGPGGMPIARPALKTKQPNVYKVDFPIKPGETRIDLSYTVPTSDPAVFEGRILHKEGKSRLVVPNGVTAKGDSIQEIGKEPQTQAGIYDINAQSFKVQLSGSGSMAAAAEAAPDEDNGAPRIEQALPHVYNHMYWIMGLAFGILGLGTYLLTRNPPPVSK